MSSLLTPPNIPNYSGLLSSISIKSTADRFNKFLENIKLTDLQIIDANTKADGVCKKLHDYFYETQYYYGSTKLIVGSYAKGTNIRPARDVDVFFKMPWKEMPDSNLLYNVQSNLLQRIKNILIEKYSSTDIKADGQVVVINFSNTHFVELIPAFEILSGIHQGKFFIPDTTNGGRWKLVDPLAEIRNIIYYDTLTNGNAKILIRMIKCWQKYCQVNIKSFVIEQVVIKFLQQYEYANKTSVYYDWMVRDFFDYLLKNVNGWSFFSDSYEIVNYGNDWQSKTESAFNRAIKACNYEINKNYYEAALEWKKIFGDDYYL